MKNCLTRIISNSVLNTLFVKKQKISFLYSLTFSKLYKRHQFIHKISFFKFKSQT